MILGIEGESNLTFCTEDQNHPVVEYIIEVEKRENPVPKIFFQPRAELDLDAYAIYMLGHPEQIDSVLTEHSSHPVHPYQIEKFPVNASDGESAIKERYQVAMLNPVGANKSVALIAITESLGIPLSAVLAFGDWHNDIPMLKTAGKAVLMGNAPSAVVAQLNHPNLFRTGTNDGSGVVDGLRRFGLL
jgi:hydroxymethylpyrimidine pyrophosphatase-like HAD family hydrolase